MDFLVPVMVVFVGLAIVVFVLMFAIRFAVGVMHEDIKPPPRAQQPLEAH